MHARHGTSPGKNRICRINLVFFIVVDNLNTHPTKHQNTKSVI
jgi:hypothetical protein